MASDIFAKIGDIKGESLDSKHKDEVEILSWSWGVSQSGSITQGGGGGAGKANFNDFNFTHHVDKASPVLLKACATGEHIKEATITVRKAGKGQQEFLIIKMNDVLITVGQPERLRRCRRHSPRASRCSSPKSHLEYKPQESRRIARCRAPLQVRHQGQQGRLTGRGGGERPRRQPGRSDSDRDSAAAERAVGGGRRHLPQHSRRGARLARRGPLLGSARPSGGAERAGSRS